MAWQRKAAFGDAWCRCGSETLGHGEAMLVRVKCRCGNPRLGAVLARSGNARSRFVKLKRRMSLFNPHIIPSRSPVAAISPEHWSETLTELSCHDVVVHSVLEAAGPHYDRLSEQEALRLMVVMLVQRHQVVMVEATVRAGESIQPPIITIPHTR